MDVTGLVLLAIAVTGAVFEDRIEQALAWLGSTAEPKPLGYVGPKYLKLIQSGEARGLVTPDDPDLAASLPWPTEQHPVDRRLAAADLGGWA